MQLKKTFLVSLLIILSFINTDAQEIITGVPFINYCPDARGRSLGQTGAATLPDIFSQNHNPAKYAFFNPKKNLLSDWNYRYLFKQDTCHTDGNFETFKEYIESNLNSPDFDCTDTTSINNNFSIALSYTPWMRLNSSSNMDLAYVVAHKKLNNYQSVAASLRYFSLDEITFMNEMGEVLDNHHPNELAVDVSYIHLLSKNFSGALTFRYIQSDLYGNQIVNTIKTHVGKSYAADMAFFYLKRFEHKRNNKAFSTGLYISNIGSKISYIEGLNKAFLPANMKLGISYSTQAGIQNSFTFNLEANKLLVPSQHPDSVYYYTNQSSEKSVVEGIFSSFSDAPGGLSGELKEIMVSGGIEYAYKQNYFLRTGYHNINNYKGNLNFLTTGLGINFILNKKILAVDAAYIIPTHKNFPLSKANISLSLTI